MAHSVRPLIGAFLILSLGLPSPIGVYTEPSRSTLRPSIEGEEQTVASKLAPAGMEEDLYPGKYPLSSRVRPSVSIDLQNLAVLDRRFVTSLYRWPSEMHLLEQTILPDLLMRKMRASTKPFDISVLILGGSTGEEAVTVTGTLLSALKSRQTPLDLDKGELGVRLAVRSVEIDPEAHAIAQRRLAGVEPLLVQDFDRNRKIRNILDTLNTHQNDLRRVIALIQADASSERIFRMIDEADVIVVNALDDMAPEKERVLFEKLRQATGKWILTSSPSFALRTGSRVYQFSDEGSAVWNAFIAHPQGVTPVWPSNWTTLQLGAVQTAARFFHTLRERFADQLPAQQIKISLIIALLIQLLPVWERVPEKEMTFDSFETHAVWLLQKARRMMDAGEIHLPPATIALLRETQSLGTYFSPDIQHEIAEILARIPRGYLDWVDAARAGPTPSPAGSEEIPPPAGAEEGIPAMEVETFAQRHPEQAAQLPEGTKAVAILPISSRITFYRPESLASAVESMIAEGRVAGLNLPIDPLPLPASADEVVGSSVILWDKSLGELPFQTRVPVIYCSSGEPFPHSLAEMVSIALFGAESNNVRILAAWSMVVEGQEVFAIALSA